MDLLRRSGRGDIWAAPPGGLPETARRSLKAPIAFGLAVTLALAGALAYSSMRSSTAVSAEDALAQFQTSRESSQDRNAGGSEATSDPRSRQKKRKSKRAQLSTSKRSGHRVEAAAADVGPGDDRASSAERPSPATERERSGSGGTRAQRRPRRPQRPSEGVYAWQVDGYEQAPGVRRDLPSQSHRVINHVGSNSWVEHHIFSEEKEQWMNLDLHAEGVTASEVRNRVVMGPVEEDNTVVYNPPVFVARLPNEVGRTWKGSWQGRTSGSYTGRTFDHTSVVIQGENVEVWASEIVMTMRGEIKGTATTRSWYSPKYSMVVKQYQIVDIESGPGSYRSEWTGQVLSVRPQT